MIVSLSRISTTPFLCVTAVPRRANAGRPRCAHMRARVCAHASAGAEAVLLDEANEDVAAGQVERAPGRFDAAVVLVEGCLDARRIEVAWILRVRLRPGRPGRPV